MEREMIAAARKKETYRLALPRTYRTAGSDGLNVGAIAACPGVGTLGIGTMGG
jgi:hypothetical protein